ncbi:hypothetical protein [Thalassotalea aquiviva]|uniref:hypothetical protein n=1 Tax=Thalassotalea aquiviva TaxID=3242415 RepID=UPI00352A1531
MVIIEILIAIFAWLTSGHAIEKICNKVGFIDTPKYVFWLPALNLVFLVYLAFAKWPNYEERN